MGIHYRGTVIRYRSKWDGGDRRIIVPFAFVVLLTLLSPEMSFAKEYRVYRCAPDTQYECAGGSCQKVTDGFQHAESFTFNRKTGVLSACLWTNCYVARAAVPGGTAPGTGTITAVGKLMPTAHPGNEPIIVSLTIHAGNHSDAAEQKTVNFTAVWGYGSKGLTLDMGECAPQGLP